MLLLEHKFQTYVKTHLRSGNSQIEPELHGPHIFFRILKQCFEDSTLLKKNIMNVDNVILYRREKNIKSKNVILGL
jgi:hypothetical protein